MNHNVCMMLYAAVIITSSMHAMQSVTELTADHKEDLNRNLELDISRMLVLNRGYTKEDFTKYAKGNGQLEQDLVNIYNNLNVIGII
ncbi:MAG: hypothetical protein WA432_01890 [Candidatus Babeliaceae bacterium]